MSDTITGYARCSTGKQDLAAPRQALLGVGGPGSRIYLPLHEDGERAIAELAELFSVGRLTVYRAMERARTRTAEGKEAAA